MAAVGYLPVAVSVHAVVSWIFAMTLRVPMNTTVLGPFFVAGAIYPGIVAIILLMTAALSSPACPTATR